MSSFNDQREVTQTGQPGGSPAPSLCAATPPPSLANSGMTTTKSYDLSLLLALATPKAQLPPPAMERINSFSEIRRDSMSDWGVDESNSTILDGEPISKSVPIPKQTKLVGVEGQGHPADDLFSYQSTPGDQAVPILIDFTTTDPFNKRPSPPSRKSSASSIFQGFPGSTSSSTTKSTLTNENIAVQLGESLSTLRFGDRTPLYSRSASPASASSDSFETISLRRSSSVASSQGSLNPFAAPWPLPQTTPKVIPTAHNPTSTSVNIPSKADSLDDFPSLPLPKILPPSLPARPNAALPPVFVKRESAALPQSMTLPDIAPLGPDWEGERGLSGNEKRRRASEMITPPQSLDKSTVIRLGESLGNTPRPERLVRLGQKLREGKSKSGGNTPSVGIKV